MGRYKSFHLRYAGLFSMLFKGGTKRKMRLIQQGFSCEYEMNVFMRLFFGKDEEADIYTYFEYSGENIRTRAKIEYAGSVYEGGYDFHYKKRDKRSDKIVFRCFVVRAFIDAAEKIRHVSIPWGALSGIRPAKVVREMMELGLGEGQVKNVMSEIFGVNENKTELALTVAKNETEILKESDKNSASLYIGIPFCPTKCLYCSFVSSDLRTGKKYTEDYVRLLDKELERAAFVLRELGQPVENIYIGGGTPTSLSEEELKLVLDSVGRNFDLSHIKEYTLEAGRADTITEGKLTAAKAAGADRISINPQTMNEETLKRVGRMHTPQMVRDAFYLARSCGFENINMDLIAGLPGENAEDFAYSLGECIKLDPENITVHCLCIKRAAAFRFSDYSLCGSDEMDKMLSFTQSEMERTGRSAYYMYRQKNISGNLENVGYAKKGCHSFYNINIMEEIQNIIACGGGATSKLVKDGKIERIFNFKDPVEYIRRFDEILKKKDDILKIYAGM